MSSQTVADTIPLQSRENPAALSQRKHIRTRLVGRLYLGLYAKFTRYGLCRDLTLPFEKPKAKIPILVRPLEDRDISQLFFHDSLPNDFAEQMDVAQRLSFIDKGARGGFVAVDNQTGTPCYVQWLFSSRDNDFIQKAGGFPVLEPHEALLENAYTPPSYRGLGIMSAAMAAIAERATEFGARRVLFFVGDHNIASLKGSQRAGFHPHMLHHRTALCFGIITRHRFEQSPHSFPNWPAKS